MQLFLYEINQLTATKGHYLLIAYGDDRKMRQLKVLRPDSRRPSLLDCHVHEITEHFLVAVLLP